MMDWVNLKLLLIGEKLPLKVREKWRNTLKK